jgi:hypothetical protein
VPRGVKKFAKFAPDKKADYLQKLREGVSPCTAARAVGVSRQLVRLYRKDHPDFAAEERLAVRESHEQVENALFKEAVAGNVTACQVWLYNRRPGRWADRRNVKLTGSGDKGEVVVKVFGKGLSFADI